METDRIKWNRRFGSEDSYLGDRPSPFLAREIGRIKRLAPGKNALDIACGEGRNSIYLALQGFRVTAMDISDVGIAKGKIRAEEAGVVVDFRQADLNGYKIIEKFDLIINFNFLLRPLIYEEVKALTPGGVLVFDTILESPQLLASHNPAYLLRHGELIRIFEGFYGDILHSEEVVQGEMPTARLLFKAAHKEQRP